MKEITIIIIVIIIVSITSYTTQKYLETTSDEILSKLSDLRTEIEKTEENVNIDNATQKVEAIIKQWEVVNSKWSMLVIHEELDNIELSLLELKSCIKTKELKDGLKEIDKSIFLVGHIKEKGRLKIKNIF